MNPATAADRVRNLAGAVVVAVAMIGSLTVLPALLSKIGDHADRGRIPFIGKRLEARRDRGESRIWNAVVGMALRRPLATLVLAAAFLIVLAIPAFRLQTASPG